MSQNSWENGGREGVRGISVRGGHLLGGTGQVCHGRNVESPTLQGPLSLLSKALMAGAPAWLLAASLPSSSRVSGGSAPLPCYYRWQVRLCLGQEGHEFYQFSWVPSATHRRRLRGHCAWGGEAPRPVTWSPPQRPGRWWGGWAGVGWMDEPRR